jgi:branched-chain amino acid transport system substrate-binding protein
VFTEALRRCGDDLTREHLVDVVTHLRGVHLPGLFAGDSINYSPTDYDAFKQFQLFRWDGTRLVPFGDLISG